MSTKKGFTVIELLVVVAIISILVSIVVAMVINYSVKGRDARRKQDLRNIAIALDLYYDRHGEYPKTANGFGGLPNSPGPWFQADYSTSDNGCSPKLDWLAPLVADGFIGEPIYDPVNCAPPGIWCWDGPENMARYYVYHSDGQHYVLCSWMENHSDTARLELNDVPNPWNTNQKLYADWNYSKYNYVIVK